MICTNAVITDSPFYLACDKKPDCVEDKVACPLPFPFFRKAFKVEYLRVFSAAVSFLNHYPFL